MRSAPRAALLIAALLASVVPTGAQEATAPLGARETTAPAGAQKTTVPAPAGGFARYDPTLSAREAVLANWDLAASGIRAGEVMGARLVAAADRGASFGALARQGATARRTLAQRWNAAQWLYEGEPGVARLDPAAMAALDAALGAECAEGACEAEAAALRDAFARVTAQLGHAAEGARAAVGSRMAGGDAALIGEQLGLVAGYLGGGGWAEGLGRGGDGAGEAVAARLVGALSLWRNLEPYVGLVDPGVDAEINAAAERVLRTLRLEMRVEGPIDPDGAEVAALRERVAVLAEAFGRAAELFARG